MNTRSIITPRLWIGLTLMALMFVAAALAPWLSPQDPDVMDLPRHLEAPSFSHPFGLDENGGDVFAKVLYGARVSLAVAYIVILIGATFGLLVGSLAGYFQAWGDRLLMRIVDVVHAFPGFILALALVGTIGPSLLHLILALCLTSWTGFARLVRGEVLHIKEREHVQAARALGASAGRILICHIWPNIFGLLTVQATFALAGTVIAEAGLSFLGLGVAASTPTWGALLNSGRPVMLEAPHICAAAGLAILLAVLGFNLVGDGLRDVLDPRRARNKV